MLISSLELHYSEHIFQTCRNLRAILETTNGSMVCAENDLDLETITEIKNHSGDQDIS